METIRTNIYYEGEEIRDSVLIDKISRNEVGVFETFRIYRGRVFRMQEHLDRLSESAKTVGCSKSINISKIKEQMRQAVRTFGEKEGFLRLTLVDNELFVMIGQRRHAAGLYRKGVRLKTSPIRRSLSHSSPPEAKTSSYHNAVMASLEPRSKEIYEWLFLDQAGCVTEVRAGNIFTVDKSLRRLCTPPPQGVLNGVTRRFVIECASRAGIGIEEKPLTRHDVFNAAEAFLTNTTWEILPVRELDGRKIGKAIPGVMTTKLSRLFKNGVEAECRKKQ